MPYQPRLCDGYINDDIQVAVEDRDNALQLSNAGPLPIHTVFCPVDKQSDNEQNRDAALAFDKLRAELQPSDIRTILGWTINTRVFNINLPMGKCVEWVATIIILYTKQLVEKD